MFPATMDKLSERLNEQLELFDSFYKYDFIHFASHSYASSKELL